MRITSWNCLCGDVSRRLSDLAPLRSDLITLQECRRPASDSASVIWRGDIPYQGVAVVSTEATRGLDTPGLQHGGVEGNDDLRSRRGRSASGRAAGDFNSSPSVQGQERASQWFLQRMREKLGLVSAYHHLSGEAHGEETRASYYHGKKEAHPFHIDYCFVPEAWVDCLTGVEVGSFADWPQSDHRPLTVDINDE